MGKKIKATITCKDHVWQAFKTWAKMNNSSASEELEKFMDRCITENSSAIVSVLGDRDTLGKNVEDMIKQSVDFHFDLYLKRKLPKILKKECFLDDTDTKVTNTDNTDDTDTKVTNTDNTDDTDTKVTNTDNTDDTDTRTKGLSDSELIFFEGLTQHKSTVARWRKKPQNQPIEISGKYIVSEDGKRWLLKR